MRSSIVLWFYTIFKSEICTMFWENPFIWRPLTCLIQVNIGWTEEETNSLLQQNNYPFFIVHTDQ